MCLPACARGGGRADGQSPGQRSSHGLRAEGYEAVFAHGAIEALEAFRAATFELAIIDVPPSPAAGLEAAKTIRRVSPRVPILFLTPPSAQEIEVRSLAFAAGGYLTKPFRTADLLLHLRSILERTPPTGQEDDLHAGLLHFGPNTVDFARLSARHGDRSFRLTPTEAKVLEYLSRQRGRIVSRVELLDAVWNERANVETRTVDNFIVRLRKRLEPDPPHPVYILSIRGAGYRFVSDADSVEER